MGDVQRARADPAREGPCARRGARGPRRRARLRVSDLPAQADRRLRPETGELLSEYCVAFPDESRPYGSARLPDSDDVLAKWMALTRRRAPADRRGQHAPARAPGRPRPRAPRPRAARALGARARLARTPRRPITWPPREHQRHFDLKHRSRSLTEGPERAAARAYLHGIGYSAEDLAKPIVGVAHSWIETMPCNFNNRVLAAKVKEGIRAAGGTPMELNTIAISDGITMGTAGMRASLVSRELIADSIELVASAHQFDALVDDLRLRQDDPGHRDGARAPGHPRADALRRLDPPRSLQGRRGDDPAGLRGRRPVRRRARSPRRSCTSSRRRPRPAPAPAAASSPRTRWRWPSRRSASRRRAPRWCPAEDGRKLEVARQCGELVMDVLRARPAPERRDHQAGARERDRRGRDERRLDQRRAAPARGRARNGRAARRSTSSSRSPSARRCSATCSPAGSTSRPTSTRRAACRSCSRG